MAMSDYNLGDVVAMLKSNDDSFSGGNGLLWLLFIMVLGWGGGGFGANNAATAAGLEVYPLLENQQNLCNGFAGLTAAINGGFANAETAATARQMADMQQMFALQTSMMQGFQAQQAQFSQMCCDNKLAIANLQAQLASEACANRTAISDGIRDIITKLDQQDLFAERRENDNLRQQISMLQLAASQTAQTAQLISELKTTAAAA